jgi:hypothetical protein
MWDLIAASVLWLAHATTPYVSCIDGHVVPVGVDCPAPAMHDHPSSQPHGGKGSSGGLLGGLVGGLL